MKNFIARVRKANRRRIAVLTVVGVVFYSLNWALAHLAGMAVAHNPNHYGISDAAVAGYFVGFIAAYALLDMVRDAEKFLSARFARKPAETK